jgi:hypothetical protein
MVRPVSPLRLVPCSPGGIASGEEFKHRATDYKSLALFWLRQLSLAQDEGSNRRRGLRFGPQPLAADKSRARRRKRYVVATSPMAPGETECVSTGALFRPCRSG